MMSVRRAAALLLLGFATVSSAQRAEPFDRTSRYVPSGDGTRLAVEIFRPIGAAGRLPVLMLQRNAGEPSAQESDVIRFFTGKGYAVVLQYRRGTGASFGTQRGFLTRDDAADAKATIEWAGSQTWSNGKVGAMGCSNQGGWQYITAALAPKHLVAMAPACASPILFDEAISRNGVSTFVSEDRKPYNGECQDAPKPGAPVDEDRDGALARAAAAEHRCNAAFLGQYQANMHRDTVNPYLGYAPGMIDSAAMHAGAIRQSGVKFLALGGWFDASPGGQLLGNRLFGGRIVVGPWQHCWGRDPGFPNGKVDTLQLQLQWFDATLKGVENGALSQPAVRYYTMNAPAGSEWRTSNAWPVAAAKPSVFYFGPARTGSVDSRNDGALTAGRPAEAADRYQPDYSVQLFEGKHNLLFRYWPGDMRPSLDRKAVTYTLAPQAAPLEVTGNPVVRLWVRSTARDADFFAILEDVGPDGKSTYVTEGAMRASRRKAGAAPWGDNMGAPYHSNLKADDQPLVSGQAAELAFGMIPTSWVFLPGHRVRVSIVNAAGPGYQQPPGTDTNNPPTIEILRGGRYASSITLPLVPAS